MSRGAFLLPGASEPLLCAGGVFEGGDFFDHSCQYGNRNHLGNFLTGFDVQGEVSKVGHEDEDLAPVAGIDDSGGGGDALGGHGRAVADQQPERGPGGGMAGLDGDAGSDTDGGAGGEFGRFKGKNVVAEIFAGVSDDRKPCSRIEEFYAEHDLYRRA